MAYSRPGIYISERLLAAPVSDGANADAAGAVVAPFASGPETVTRVTSWYEFTKIFGGYNALYPASFQVGAFFTNGGKDLYVKRVLHTDAAAASVADGITTSGDALVADVTAKNKGADGNNLRVKLDAGSVSGTWTLSLYKEIGVANVIADDLLLERYDNVVFDDPTSSDYAETVINLVSSYITISNSDSGTPVAATYPLTGGANGTAVVSGDYTNYQNSGNSVFEDYSTLNRPLVIFLPGVAGMTNDGDIIDAATGWAAVNNGFVVVETPADFIPDEAIDYAGALQDTSYAAVYYPHLYIADPIGRSNGALRKIGPAGSIAGLYIYTDSRAGGGVFKAPAGIGAQVRGTVALERAFTSSQLDDMNSSTSPVNPIRQVPGSGSVVMGARTLLQDGTANKYVNMRRSLIYINSRLRNITEFALFENNDTRLWAQLRTSIAVFLGEYRNQGGLRGATQTQSFFIKIDGENNTAASIANGEVHIQVGVALEYPAEFIVIDLSQKTIN